MRHDATILLVEDNLDDVFFMRRAFQSAEVTNPVQVVSTGQAAIDYLSGEGQYSDRTQFPLPCLVLLDLKLPRKGGHDVLEWIRQQPSFYNLVVVFLTTSKEERDIQQAYRLGANAYLVKPTTPAQLREMVRAIRDFWIVHNTFL